MKTCGYKAKSLYYNVECSCQVKYNTGLAQGMSLSVAKGQNNIIGI